MHVPNEVLAYRRVRQESGRGAPTQLRSAATTRRARRVVAFAAMTFPSALTYA